MHQPKGDKPKLEKSTCQAVNKKQFSSILFENKVLFDLQFGILITALILLKMYKADNIILVKHLWESQTRKPKEIKQHFFLQIKV